MQAVKLSLLTGIITPDMGRIGKKLCREGLSPKNTKTNTSVYLTGLNEISYKNKIYEQIGERNICKTVERDTN